jgi:hypothetical protein
VKRKKSGNLENVLIENHPTVPIVKVSMHQSVEPMESLMTTSVTWDVLESRNTQRESVLEMILMKDPLELFLLVTHVKMSPFLFVEQMETHTRMPVRQDAKESPLLIKANVCPIVPSINADAQGKTNQFVEEMEEPI